MSVNTTAYPTLIDKHMASAAELAPLAFSGFAHFTAMQIRDAKAKGMDLHLARLRSASLALFRTALSDEDILVSIRLALEHGPADMSLTVTLFVPNGEFTDASMGGRPSILVRSNPPHDGPAGPLRLHTVEHERHLASIKHVGEGAKTYFLHRALEQGFDDAAFVDRHGRLSEASIWNLVFWDGQAVVWPQAEILIGTTMGIVQRQLERMGVPQRRQDIGRADLAKLSGAAVMNSWTPGVPVTAIGEHAFPVSRALMQALNEAWQAEPWLAI
jgi:branched-subunit amino acid aminotransferase/4-amino-4-deoxychorismate lyase